MSHLGDSGILYLKNKRGEAANPPNRKKYYQEMDKDRLKIP